MSGDSIKWYIVEIGSVDLNNSKKFNIKFIKPINRYQYDEDVKLIHEFHKDIQLIRAVELNFNDLMSEIKRNLHKFKNKSSEIEKRFEIIRFEYSRLILNLLSMFRSFLDHSECSIKRNYGKDSSQWKEWKLKVSMQFDNNKEYRIFYKLRNFCQHVGMPPINISFGQDDNIPPYHKVWLNRDNLLFEKSVLGAKVIHDLSEYPQDIELVQFLINWFRCFQSLSEKVIHLALDRSLASAARVSGLRKEGQASDDCQLGIMKDFDLNEGDGFLDLDIEHVPENLAVSILEMNNIYRSKKYTNIWY